MKTIALTLVVWLLLGANASAADKLVIVPARGLSTATNDALLAQIVTSAVEKLPTDTEIEVIDPVSFDLVAKLKVPSGTKAQRERNATFAQQITPLRLALSNRAQENGWEASTLRIPEVLRFLSEQIVARGEKATVVFVGSPLYRGRAGTFDFSNGMVPSDGWLNASTEDSPFATSGINCKNWCIHIAVTQPVWAESEWQAKEVQRFWSAFVNATGGSLVSLAPMSVIWDRVNRGSHEGLGFRPVDSNDHTMVWRKKIFIRGEEQEAALKSNDMTDATESLPQSVVVTTPAEPLIPSRPAPQILPASIVIKPVVTPVQTTTNELAPVTALEVKANVLPTVAPGRIGIGLVWETEPRYSADCDLDLWVKVSGESEVNFKHMRSGPANAPHVRLYEDIRKAKGLSGTRQPDFEFVEVNRPVLPRNVEVWVDVYQNTGRRPIHGLVQIEFQGKKYTKTIEFPATNGDRAANAARRAQSAYWMRIDVDEVSGRLAHN